MSRDSKRTKALWRRWVTFDRPWTHYSPSLREWVQGEMSGGMPDPEVARWANRKGIAPLPF